MFEPRTPTASPQDTAALPSAGTLEPGRSLHEFLVDKGVITPAQLDIAQRKQRALLLQGRRLEVIEILIRDRFVTKEQISVALEHSDESRTGGVLQALLPAHLCQRLMVIPIKVEQDVLHVRAAQRLTEAQQRLILNACVRPVTRLRVVAADRVELRNRVYEVASDETSVAAMIERLRQAEMSSSALKQLIDAMLTEAVLARASDIHLDSKADPDSWVSYRIDNDLQQRHQVPHRIMAALFIRIKMEGGMDASDSLRAQDGRMGFEFQGRPVDLRLASQPIAGGETLTMRVLDPESMPSLDSMFPAQPDMIALFQSLAQVHGKNGGLIFISGPTGSGKTTTLYAIAQRFARDRVNVVTVEDPVEYLLPFARQIQINQLLNQRTQDVERSVLRQDPDVLIFGEIRDADSARAAMKLTESGHLVLATVHSVTAIQIYERLIAFFDEGSRPDALYIMAHYLRLMINQRLIPRLCDCARPATQTDLSSIKRRLVDTGVSPGPVAQLRIKVGCARCNGRGYYGRVVAHETIVIPNVEDLRIEIGDWLIKNPNQFHQVRKMQGVRYTSRANSIERLLHAGLIDADTARRAVGI
jgi:type II secretory ATPase GspE/PulE/Tfp pilus assembly ATPase PilB-like protein